MDETLKPAKTVIFDIDGTLARIDHRRQYLSQSPPDWAKFNSAMSSDSPNPAVVALYNLIWHSARYEVLLVTGRNERHRIDTEAWLDKHQIPYDMIMMRPDGDFRADEVFKEELLDGLLEDQRDIEFVVDDRQQVVNMWRRRGITCFQCDVGDF